jgi:hypothetical protein
LSAAPTSLIMALAFKRSVAEAEAQVVSANDSIKGWYSPPVFPALVMDYESAKAVQGTSKQNANSEEGPKSITILNWVKDYASRFHSIWGDIQYKDKEYALPIALKHIDKVVVHFDDKSPSGKYNTYSTKIEGKDIHITVHFDFDNYPQQLDLTEPDQVVWAHLEKVAHISFEMRKAKLQNYEYSSLKSAVDKVKEVSGKAVPITVDWDGIFKIEGETEWYSEKPKAPNNFLALYFLDEMSSGGFYGVQWSVDALVKDELGKEAFKETFDSIVVHVASGAANSHTATKDGKVLHYNFKVDFSSFWNNSTDYSALAKQMEALL